MKCNPEATFMSPPLVPVHADTVEYAKRLIDELHSSKGTSKPKRSVPQVPSFLRDDLNRKMSAQELFGETDTDNVSETDWDEKKCSSSEGERSGGLDEAEDYYSEAEHNTDSGESSGSDYESGSSFEESRKKKQARKCNVMGKSKAAGSATSKQAAAARKKKHQIVQERAFVNSPQSIHLKQKMTTIAKGKSVPKKKTKADASSSQSQSESEKSSSENEMDFEVQTKTGGKATAKKKGKEVVSKEAVEAGKKPAKGSKHEVRRVAGTFEGDMREGVPIVDNRPGKKRTRAGRKRKDSRRGRKQARNLKGDVVDKMEVLPPKSAQLRPTPDQLGGVRIQHELPGVEEDPMLPEEVLIPLIVNELADDGIVVVNEMKDELKIWDAQVSCRGGYNWVMGDVNSHTFADLLSNLLLYQMGHQVPTFLAWRICMQWRYSRDFYH